MNSSTAKCYMNSFCRICANNENVTLTSILDQELLSLKILRCLHVHVTMNDELPTSVCAQCLHLVEKSYELFEACCIADKKLRKLWKTMVKEQTVTESTVVVHNYVDGESTTSLPSNIYEKQRNAIIITLPDDQGRHCSDTCQEAIIHNVDEHISDNLLTQSDAEVNKIVNFHRCTFCSQCYETKGDLKKHVDSTHPSSRTKVFPCKLCSRVLSTSASLSVHEATHSQDKAFLCDTCGKSFKHSNNLRSHSRTHHGLRKKYNCDICCKSFYSNFLLKDHMNIHSGKTPYKCGQCSKEFRERVHLRQHSWTHSAKKFKCSVCGSQFNRKGNMAEHIKKFHLKDEGGQKGKPDNPPVMLNPAGPYPCPMCADVFPVDSLMKTHLKSHSAQQYHHCVLCTKKFLHRGSLTYHKRTAHTGEKPFRCSFCPESFALRSVQKIHERRAHTGDLPFRCSLCPSRFANPSSFKNHSYVHLKEKAFGCGECGAKFARKGALEVHKKLHSGVREFKCDQCGRSFVQKHDMMKHKKSHDPSRKPFFCKCCGNSFSRKKDSAKHAMCHLNLAKRSDLVETCSAERMLDSVSSVFQQNAKGLFEEEQLILDSVEQFSKSETADL